MGLEMAPVATESSPEQQPEVAIYPLCRYYFGAKDARPCAGETAADRALRLKANFAARGLRTCVHGVLLVELSGHPHVLLLQVRNSSFLLPGGRLRPAEQDLQGLKRKLSSKLAAEDRNGDHHWQIGECIGMWWRSEFDARPFPYPPPNTRVSKASSSEQSILSMINPLVLVHNCKSNRGE
uniref:Pre-mRNA cleavage factor Im 25 kDa subunit n=1 Tax=Hordeum vulgare subsp. vulgare TaxID=112509 RepID=A0A8I6YEY4_HORVV